MTELPGWLRAEIGTVPSFGGFAGVDQLPESLRRIAERYPDVASLRRCGTSRQGDPLWCLTVDGGAGPEALAFGLPHPNEPIGGLAALHLAERLCADGGLRERLRHRWRIVGCADPDYWSSCGWTARSRICWKPRCCPDQAHPDRPFWPVSVRGGLRRHAHPVIGF
jgi:hypothetical protein